MKKLILAVAAFVQLSCLASESFPRSPDLELTPGSLCTSSGQYRYPEHIRYCSRNVDSGLKKEIIRNYDRTLGYSIGQMDRDEFKIDHYIPLCMGGSNQPDNLWPQHESVYQATDRLEEVSCRKMSQGKLKQIDAISIIKRAKADISEAPRLIDYVESL